MRTRLSVLALFVVVLVICGCGGGEKPQQESPKPLDSGSEVPSPTAQTPMGEGFVEPEVVLPKGAIMVVLVSDCSKFVEMWNDSFVSKIADEPDVKKVWERIKQKMGKQGADPLNQISERFQQITGEKLENLKDVFKGAFGFALLGMGERSPQSTKILFFLDAKERKALLEKIIGNATNKIVEESKEMEGGPKHTIYEYEGCMIHKLGDGREDTYGVFVGTKWLFSTDEQILKDAVLRCKNLNKVDDGSLARDESYKKLRSQLGEGRVEALFYFDYKRFFDEFDKVAPDLETAEMIKKMKKDFDMSMAYAMMRIESGIVERQVMDWERMNEFLTVTDRPSPTKMLAESDDILAYGCVGFNMKNYWKFSLEAFRMNQTGVRMLDLSETVKELEQRLGISIDELLGALGERMEFYVCKPSGGGAYPEFFFTIELKDAKKLDSIVESVLKRIKEEAEKEGQKFEFSRTDFKGLKLTSVDINRLLKEFSREIETKESFPYELSWTVSEGKLVVASSPQTLKGVLDSVKSPFEAKGILKDVLLKCPQKINGFYYMNTPALISYLYNTFIPLAKETIKRIGLEMADMPEAKVIAKHCPHIWSYTIVEGRLQKGAIFTSNNSAVTPSIVSMVVAIALAYTIKNIEIANERATEMSVVGTLKALSACQWAYQTKKGSFAKTFEELEKEGFVNVPKVEGYEFVILGADKKGFSIVANPKKGSPFKKYFFVNETGVVRESNTPDVGPNSYPAGR